MKVVDEKQVYETLDYLVRAHIDGNFPQGRTGVDCEAFKYVNSLESQNRHVYLKYYFQKTKTRE